MQSEYFITSRLDDNVLSLDEDQFKELKRARKRLSSAYAITHKFRLVNANLQMVFDAMSRLGRLYVDQAGSEALETAKPHLNACVNNYVLSARIFTSQLKRHVQACVPQERDLTDALTQQMEKEYRLSFAYRFVDSLYDYVSQYGISIHTLMLESLAEEDENGVILRRYSLKALVEKDYIGGPAEFRVSVFEEVKEQINLIDVLSEFNESVKRLHDYAMEMVKTAADESNLLISEFINVFAAEHGKEHNNLFVVHMTSALQNKIYDKFPISMYANNHNMESEYV